MVHKIQDEDLEEHKMSEQEQAKAQELADLCREIPAGDQDYIKGIMVGLTKAAQKYEQKEEQKQ